MEDHSMIETPSKTTEINIINTELLHNKVKFDFYINKINEDKLRFILLNKNNSIFIEKYHVIYTLEQLKSINKYFKMFEILNELQDDLLEIIKDNNIEIINVSKDEIIIILKVSLKNDNIIKLKLQKLRIDDNDKINFLLEEFKGLKKSNEIKDKKIIELENNISNITKEINEKNQRIESFENNLIKQYNEIKDKKIIELENKISTISKEINEKSIKIESLENNLRIYNEIKNKKIVELENNISTISKEINEKNKRIESLENNLLKQNSEIKDTKIIELENKISKISKELNNKNKRIDSLENNINESQKVFNIFKEEINKKILSINFGNILKASNIFKIDEEIELLLSNIPFKANNLKLLYDSEIEGENEEKLLNEYTDKNDLIVLVKTNKSKRFGGYAHKCFEKNKFRKNDMKAFLFNLDKKEIYKSIDKLSNTSIWRESHTFDSINFGSGTDLKIFHKFFNKECQTKQSSWDYDYKNEEYALNGERNFKISYLEIYQVH